MEEMEVNLDMRSDHVVYHNWRRPSRGIMCVILTKCHIRAEIRCYHS